MSGVGLRVRTKYRTCLEGPSLVARKRRPYTPKKQLPLSLGGGPGRRREPREQLLRRFASQCVPPACDLLLSFCRSIVAFWDRDGQPPSKALSMQQRLSVCLREQRAP